MPKIKNRDQHLHVSASELASMGACEMRIVLEHRHGRRLSEAQRLAVARGLKLHAEFLAQAQTADRPRSGRCFIASHVFGPDAPETQALRAYRDRVLRASAAGRMFILCYYRLAPGCCRWLARFPLLCTLLRTLLRRGLRPLVAFASRRNCQGRQSHGD